MVAGIIIRQSLFKEVPRPNWEEHELSKSVHIIAFGFLIPLFFVWIGLSTDVSLVWENAGLILLFLVIATVGTVGGSALAVVINGESWRQGWLLGWGLNPKGDMELIIASLALKAGIISAGIFTALIMMSLLTTIISPIVFERLVTSHRKYVTRAS